MKPIRIALFCVLVLGAIISSLTGGEQPNASFRSVKLTGIFDPYEVRDTNVTYAVVMEARPKCGQCHAWAVLSQNAGAPRLELFVAHGRTTNSWVMVGQSKDRQIVFEKSKLRLTFSDGCLKGAYDGRMRARIELKTGK
ncbi:MAG: hypothetical protein FJ388_13770 [Verrucomicrobia bacterium]|nr:hypothetical protein [Verrucomicrobiota bacterium]